MTSYRFATIMLLAGLGWAPLGGCRATSTGAASSEVKAMKHYVVRFSAVRSRDTWGDREQRVSEAHLAYLRTQQREGYLQLGGVAAPSRSGQPGFGMVVYAVDTEAMVQRLVTEDPAIAEGLLTAEVFGFNRLF